MMKDIKRVQERERVSDEVKLLSCEDLSDDKCAICGKHKSWHGTGSGFGMCQIYPLFVSEREMLERLTRAIEVTDEVGEKVAKAIEDADNAWFEIRARDRVGTIWQSMACAAIAAMKDAASEGGEI